MKLVQGNTAKELPDIDDLSKDITQYLDADHQDTFDSVAGEHEEMPRHKKRGVLSFIPYHLRDPLIIIVLFLFCF